MNRKWVPLSAIVGSLLVVGSIALYGYLKKPEDSPFAPAPVEQEVAVDASIGPAFADGPNPADGPNAANGVQSEQRIDRAAPAGAASRRPRKFSGEGFEGALAAAAEMADQLCLREDEVECIAVEGGYVYLSAELLDQLDETKKRYPDQMRGPAARAFIQSLKKRLTEEKLGAGGSPDRQLSPPEIEDRDHLVQALSRFED